jgi:hypothetical protein
MVLRVDKDKGYIDLSKRRVSPEDIAASEDKFNKSKMVHSIMRHVAETTGQNVEELYKDVGWPLYKKYGHAFEAFKVRHRCLCCCYHNIHVISLLELLADSSLMMNVVYCDIVFGLSPCPHVMYWYR